MNVLFAAILTISCSLLYAENYPAILYSNDTTHITSCASPYHKKGEQFQEQMLVESAKEVCLAGADVQMLQPGMGWVPWWQSEYYPMKEHVQWLSEVNPKNSTWFDNYVLNGGDLISVFIDTCNKYKTTPFISYRLNDYHNILGALGAKSDAEREKSMANCKFYYEHPEFRIGEGKHGVFGERFNEYLLDWSYPEVREYKFNLIKEVCQKYPIKGLELDFMRHSCYFNSEKTTSEQRIEIMTGFIKQVREVLDSTSRDGEKRLLCVRVPFRLKDCDKIGVSFPEFVEAGVDMVNLSVHYVTQQQSDIAQIHKLIPNVPIYYEMTFVANRFANPENTSQEFFVFTSDQQFYTTAHLAYSRGAKGMSLFNFVYYRSFNETWNGVANAGISASEPPFHVIRNIKYPQWVADQPQHYFLSMFDANNQRVTKVPLTDGKVFEVNIDMAPPTNGWITDGRLRIQFLTPYGESKWKVSINGTELESQSDISEPYPTKYEEGLGNAKTLLAWKVSKDTLIDGINKIEITPSGTDIPQIINIDINIR